MPVACLVTVSLWETEEYDITSTPDSGRWRTRAPINDGDWGVNIESVTVLTDPDEALYFTWEFFLELARSNGVNIELVITDKNGGTKVYRGKCFLPRNEINGTAGDVSRSNIQLIGSGGLQFDGSVTPQSFNTMRLQWLAADGQTEFQDNELIGRTVDDVLYVHREGEDKYTATAIAPVTNRDVQLDAVLGKLIFLIASDVNMLVYCIIRTN